MELNETTLEQILARQEEKYEYRMGILVEGIRSDIKGVADGVVLLREELDGVKTDLEDLKTDVGALRTDVDVLKTDVAVLRTDVEVLKVDMDIVKTELAIIRNDLKQKVGRDEFALLEARVAMLERSGRARG
jgi:hypothetical protein